MVQWSETQKADVARAVEAGLSQYLSTRRARIDAFVDRHFSVRGAWQINKKAFGRDMLKTPVNILWAPPHFLLSTTGKLLLKGSGQRLGARLANLPLGFKTDVEREVTWRLYSDFLELPYQDGTRVFTENRLLQIILEQPALESIFSESLNALAAMGQDATGRARLSEHLLQYVDSRKAAVDLSAVLISVATGYVANKSVNLGALGLGTVLATHLAHQAAVSSFVFGNTLGALYYSVFTVTASKTAIAMSSGGIAVVLGLVSAYTGVITDPLQRALGWHQKRLHTLVDNLECVLLSQEAQAKTFKAGYVARVLDIADLMMSLVVK